MCEGYGKCIWMDERKGGRQDQRGKYGSMEDMHESVVGMELAPSVECKWKGKSEWMDKKNWKAMDTWREDSSIYLRGCDPLIFVFFFFIFKEFLLSCSQMLVG